MYLPDIFFGLCNLNSQEIKAGFSTLLGDAETKAAFAGVTLSQDVVVTTPKPNFFNVEICGESVDGCIEQCVAGVKAATNPLQTLVYEANLQWLNLSKGRGHKTVCTSMSELFRALNRKVALLISQDLPTLAQLLQTGELIVGASDYYKEPNALRTYAKSHNINLNNGVFPGDPKLVQEPHLFFSAYTF